MKNRIRFYLGLSCFILAWILPLFGFLVARMPLPLAAKATIIGLLTVGGPEIFGILAVVILGRANLMKIKDQILAFLRFLKPSAVVSRWRYRLGLVMFLLPIIPTYLMAYAPQWLPDHSPQRLYVNLAADFLFLASLFVLGEDFWDKLQALFRYDVRVQLEPQPVEKSP
jgi:hypothetical protein